MSDWVPEKMHYYLLHSGHTHSTTRVFFSLHMPLTVLVGLVRTVYLCPYYNAAVSTKVEVQTPCETCDQNPRRCHLKAPRERVHVPRGGVALSQSEPGPQRMQRGQSQHTREP